jgi:hypothetical protein
MVHVVSSDADAVDFTRASLQERAVLILIRAFRPDESTSRQNVANAIANTSGGATAGGVVVSGPHVDVHALHLVSEAWQVLESARLICRDLSQFQGDWWRLTGAGRQAHSSSDPLGEIILRLPGGF